jgi:transcription termination/antitermination protein NusG
MLRLSDNPPMLYPADTNLEEASGRWWVAHTKSRNEKALAHTLRKWDMPYYLPMVERIHVRRNRKVRSLVPLFPGYLFFTGEDNNRYRVMTTNRVANVIHVENQEVLSVELSQIHKAIVTGAELQPYLGIPKGTRCRITSGVFKGLEGIVLHMKGNTQLVLQVEALGQAVALEIDLAMVEKVYEEPTN